MIANKKHYKNTKSVTAKEDIANFGGKINSFLTSPLKVFVVLSLTFGFITLFTMPAFMVPDEYVHFDRAYVIGSGKFLGDSKNGEIGGKLPYIPEAYKTNAAQPLTREQLNAEIRVPDKFVSFPSASLYSPVVYAPQAIGIDIAKSIHKTAASMVFGGRFINLLVFTLLIATAISIARQGKWVYVVVGLLPMSIQQSASLSADVVTMGLAFILIAYIHRIFLQKVRFSKKQFFILLMLAISLGLTKQTNLALLFPLLFLPARLFLSQLNKFIVVGAVVAIAILFTGGWYHLATSVYDKTLSITQMTKIPEGVDQSAQVKFIKDNPKSPVRTLFRTYVFEGFVAPINAPIPISDFLVISAVGYFSWFAYKLPLSFIVMSYILLFIALLYREKKPDQAHVKRLAIVQGVSFIFSVLLISLVLYLQWTPVGFPQIAGLQGRYYLPLIPLLIPIFTLLAKYIQITFDKPYRMGQIVVIASSANFFMMTYLTIKWFN